MRVVLSSLKNQILTLLRPRPLDFLGRSIRDPPNLLSVAHMQDVARLAVTTQIASMVQENYAALVGGMRQVQAVDLDLARAGVQVGGEGRRGRGVMRERGGEDAVSYHVMYFRCMIRADDLADVRFCLCRYVYGALFRAWAFSACCAFKRPSRALETTGSRAVVERLDATGT